MKSQTDPLDAALQFKGVKYRAFQIQLIQYSLIGGFANLRGVLSIKCPVNCQHFFSFTDIAVGQSLDLQF